jgi:hypothetical protein
MHEVHKHIEGNPSLMKGHKHIKHIGEDHSLMKSSKHIEGAFTHEGQQTH